MIAGDDVMHTITSPYLHPRIWILGSRLKSHNGSPHWGLYVGLSKTFLKLNRFIPSVSLWLSLSVQFTLKRDMVCKFSLNSLAALFNCIIAIIFIPYYFLLLLWFLYSTEWYWSYIIRLSKPEKKVSDLATSRFLFCLSPSHIGLSEA